jgi:hypothetical protein
MPKSGLRTAENRKKKAQFSPEAQPRRKRPATHRISSQAEPQPQEQPQPGQAEGQGERDGLDQLAEVAARLRPMPPSAQPPRRSPIGEEVEEKEEEDTD